MKELATQGAGTHARTRLDVRDELRLFALEQMSGMGADMFLADAHRYHRDWPDKARGRTIALQPRLRSGSASSIAAGIDRGRGHPAGDVETVERGYGRLVERLIGLGAQVQRQV